MEGMSYCRDLHWNTDRSVSASYHGWNPQSFDTCQKSRVTVVRLLVKTSNPQTPGSQRKSRILHTEKSMHTHTDRRSYRNTHTHTHTHTLTGGHTEIHKHASAHPTRICIQLRMAVVDFQGPKPASSNHWSRFRSTPNSPMESFQNGKAVLFNSQRHFRNGYGPASCSLF